MNDFKNQISEIINNSNVEDPLLDYKNVIDEFINYINEIAGEYLTAKFYSEKLLSSIEIQRTGFPTYGFYGNGIVNACEYVMVDCISLISKINSSLCKNVCFFKLHDSGVYILPDDVNFLNLMYKKISSTDELRQYLLNLLKTKKVKDIFSDFKNLLEHKKQQDEHKKQQEEERKKIAKKDYECFLVAYNKKLKSETELKATIGGSQVIKILDRDVFYKVRVNLKVDDNFISQYNPRKKYHYLKINFFNKKFNVDETYFNKKTNTFSIVVY